MTWKDFDQVLLALVVAAFALPIVRDVACTLPEQKLATALVTGTLDVVCKELETQPEPDYVRFACDTLDAEGKVVQSYEVKTPAASATAFRARHVRVSKDGGGH